jgi:hypothetical protein
MWQADNQGMEFHKNAIEVIRVTPQGQVLINWLAVERVVNEPVGDPQTTNWCKILLAVRDGTWKAFGELQLN